MPRSLYLPGKSPLYSLDTRRENSYSHKDSNQKIEIKHLEISNLGNVAGIATGYWLNDRGVVFRDPVG
jgi:hypothetical protein